MLPKESLPRKEQMKKASKGIRTRTDAGERIFLSLSFVDREKRADEDKKNNRHR